MLISKIKGYNILLQDDMENLPDDIYKTKYKGKPSTLNLLTKLHTAR